MLTVVLWGLGLIIDLPSPLEVQRIFPPQWAGSILASVCLLQFMVGFAAESRHEKKLFRLFFWLIWYPAIYWVINAVSAVVGLQKALFKRRAALAVWESPDRGLQDGKYGTEPETSTSYN